MAIPYKAGPPVANAAPASIIRWVHAEFIRVGAFLNSDNPHGAMIFRGAHAAGQYRANDVATAGGVTYIALVDTTNTPPHADWAAI